MGKTQHREGGNQKGHLLPAIETALVSLTVGGSPPATGVGDECPVSRECPMVATATVLDVSEMQLVLSYIQHLVTAAPREGGQVPSLATIVADPDQPGRFTVNFLKN